MEITVNGQRREVEDKISVAALIAQLGVERKYVVVERNGTILDREVIDAAMLHPGDRVELIHFIGGGQW